ncbi:MAG: hypothetical protein PVH42_12815 [Desulfobacterales bacterium]|jgi:hypothetical protein
MRTTIEIPDHLLRRAKAAAALEGKSLKAFLAKAVKHELERSAEKKIVRKKVSLPLIPSKRPGTLQLSSQDITNILDKEDQHVLAGH